jgi:hypothetical protein
VREREKEGANRERERWQEKTVRERREVCKLKAGIRWGKTHDRPFLKTNSQKSTVTKLLSYTASSLVETSSIWNSSFPETSSRQKLLRGIFLY